MISIPDFYDDPLFRELQSDLIGTGRGMLVGDLPDFYDALGQSNSPEFQDVLRMSNRDIEQSALNTAAKTGTRGPAVTSMVTRATADNSAKLRWQDLLNSLEDKKWLLGTGISTVGSARDSQFSFMGAKNSYALDKARLDINQDQFEKQMANQKKAQKASTWSQILSSAIGAAGTIGGYMIGGPAGGMVGAKLGSAAGSSGMSDNALDFAMQGINSSRGW